MNVKRLLALVLPLLCFGIAAFAQDKTVTGKVTDSKDGSPVVAASVLVKGTKIGTSTGADGSFTLKVPASATTLVISSIGFGNKEVAIGSGAITVSLEATNNNLNEVVVIGYGTARKKM